MRGVGLDLFRHLAGNAAVVEAVISTDSDEGSTKRGGILVSGGALVSRLGIRG